MARTPKQSGVIGRLRAGIRGFRNAYEATRPSTKRRDPSTIIRSEDRELDDQKRRTLEATGLDLVRNLTIAGWMIRKDIDFCSTFSFQCKSKDRGFNREFEQAMAWWTRPGAFEISGRFDLGAWMQIAHATAILGGDLFVQKFPSTARIAAIEPDRVTMPRSGEIPAEIANHRNRWVNGVLPNGANAIQKICVCNRTKGGSYEYARLLSGKNIWQMGDIGRFDSLRGISPLAPAINELVDTHEMFGHAKARAKLANMFGLAFFRSDKFEEQYLQNHGQDLIDGVDGVDEDEQTLPGQSDKYPVKLNGAPFKVEMDIGDRLAWLNTNLNASDTAQIVEMLIMLALKGLDIPMSFYDEARTNYYASKGAKELYFQSCRRKRRPNQQFLRRYTLWRTKLAILNGEFSLPRGMTMRDITFAWIPTGTFWLDRLREYKADSLAVENGQTSTVRLGHRDGYDAYEILAEQTEYEKERARLRNEAGLDQPTTTTPNITPERDDSETTENLAEAVADELEARGLVLAGAE